MKSPLTILFFSCALLAYAQDEIKVTATYYSKTDERLPDETGAYYCRVDSTAGDKEVTYSYYTSNKQLRHLETYVEPKTLRYEVWYYENGQKMWQGNRRFNTVEGKINMWYPNGNKLAMLDFPAGEQAMLIRQYWDSLGTQLVTNGEGSGDFKFPSVVDSGNGSVVGGHRHNIWVGTGAGYTYEERYDHGKLVAGVTTKDGKSYNYTKIEEAAVPVEKLEGFYRFVSVNLVYPTEARRMGQEGKVFVEFVVYTDGVVRDVRIAKGIGKECDEEAMRVIRLSPKWNPGLQ